MFMEEKSSSQDLISCLPFSLEILMTYVIQQDGNISYTKTKKQQAYVIQ